MIDELDDVLREVIDLGTFHDPCGEGTDFRKAWIREKRYMMRRVVSEIGNIISTTKNRIPVNEDAVKNCRWLVCGGCIDHPKQIHFYPGQMFSFYCPKYNTKNLCSFRAISYYCDGLCDFLHKLNVDAIDMDFLMELEGICQEIYKKTFMLAGIHNKTVAVKAQYIKGPGAKRRAEGEETLRIAMTVLVKCGGIAGYDSLSRGRKKPFRAAIKKECLLEERHVYRILNKIRKLTKTMLT